MTHQKNYFYFLLSVMAQFMLTMPATAQNVTSPYSILGIGDVDTKDFGRYFSSGNAALSRRDAVSYNFSNPASLTALPFKLMNLDFATRGRFSTFSSPNTDTSTGVTKDFVVKRASMGFKVTTKTALAFGLKPYSSVNYKFKYDQSILDGNSSYTKSIDGSGGVNQYYVSAATQLGKHVSAGITASWLSGSTQKATTYTGSGIDLDITKTETNFHYGSLFQTGLQYYTTGAKKWKHVLGLTGSISTGLRSQIATAYSGSGVSVKETVEAGTKFKMPVTVGLGYSAVKRDRLTLSVEGNYCYWPYQKVDYTNSYTSPSVRLSAGLDYSFKHLLGNTLFEKSYLAFGMNVENSYLTIQNNHLWDYSFSLGGGVQLFRNVVVNTGLEIGNKGNKQAGQIKEQYTQFVFGITVKEIWLGSRKFGAFR